RTLLDARIRPARMNATDRYRSIDLWRGVACLLVVVHHAARYADKLRSSPGLPNAVALGALRIVEHFNDAVPFFFVISGYCIMAACQAAQRNQMSASTFFKRRFRRIFPPYWAACLFALAILAAPALFGGQALFHKQPFLELTPGQWLGNAALAEGIRPRLIGPPAHYFLGQSWTLCYEEQFYAVMGLLLLVGRSLFRYAMWVTAAVLAIFLFTNFHPAPISGFFFDGHWLLFAAGILVHQRLTHPERRPARAIDAVLIVACAASVIWWIIGSPAIHAAPGLENPFNPESYAVGFAFALLLLLLRPWDDRIVATAAARPLLLCGFMCYSLYLTHSASLKTSATL